MCFYWKHFITKCRKNPKSQTPRSAGEIWNIQIFLSFQFSDGASVNRKWHEYFQMLESTSAQRSLKVFLPVSSSPWYPTQAVTLLHEFLVKYDGMCVLVEQVEPDGCSSEVGYHCKEFSWCKSRSNPTDSHMEEKKENYRHQTMIKSYILFCFPRRTKQFF